MDDPSRPTAPPMNDERWHTVRTKAALGELLKGREVHVVPTGFDLSVKTTRKGAVAMLESARVLLVYTDPRFALVDRYPEDD